MLRRGCPAVAVPHPSSLNPFRRRSSYLFLVPWSLRALVLKIRQKTHIPKRMRTFLKRSLPSICRAKLLAMMLESWYKAGG
jgi:hypothetical protein